MNLQNFLQNQIRIGCHGFRFNQIRRHGKRLTVKHPPDFLNPFKSFQQLCLMRNDKIAVLHNLSDFCFYYNFEEPLKGDPVSIQIVLELAASAEERAQEKRFTSLRIQVTEQLKAWNIYNYKMPQRIGMMNDKQLIVFSECINETKSKIEREQGAINNIASFARKTLSEIFEKRQKIRDESIDSVEQDATNYYYLSDDSNCNGIEKKLFEKIKNKIHPDIFNTFFKPCGLKIDLGEKQVKVTMVAPSKFVVDKIEINYRDHLREAIKEVFPAKNPYLVYHIK